MNPNSSRDCRQCGAALPSGAQFCRACGAKDEGAACESCRAPLVAGQAFCRSCGNRVEPAVAEVPAATTAATAIAPTSAKSPQPSPPAPAPPRSGKRLPLAAGAIILLIGAGVAAAIILTRPGDPGETTASDENAAASASADPESTEAGEERSSSNEGEGIAAGLPTVSLTEMAEEIQPLLLTYHEDIVSGDFQGAWSLLSPRKRQQYLEEYGFRKWMGAQASLSPYLSPSGLTVRVEALEDDEVARVMVTGMGWTAPSSPCSQWSGRTWVKYQDGEWTYDPGYSTTASRRGRWQPRAAELLGAGC